MSIGQKRLGSQHFRLCCYYLLFFRQKCESLLEDYEDRIEEWYNHQQENENLQKFLCRQHVLSISQQKCLDEKGETKAKNEL